MARMRQMPTQQTLELHPDLRPMIDCPRWDGCGVPICPLDPGQEQRDRLAGEPKCRLSKAKRAELGADLPWRGLTPRELSAQERWEQMTAEEQHQVSMQGKKPLGLVHSET